MVGGAGVCVPGYLTSIPKLCSVNCRWWRGLKVLIEPISAEERRVHDCHKDGRKLKRSPLKKSSGHLGRPHASDVHNLGYVTISRGSLDDGKLTDVQPEIIHSATSSRKHGGGRCCCGNRNRG
ncbi:hypothetical protein H6P81_013248 [Aristolochia fimbriata]|uniref:Uncharacterized protein n=1 Tax=Aristolochia fimbriata TaxID=158543 RepID=A0AAV7EE64_ARIFI|nr:hypothetical protein H6P81_013248 [Aristolochia fimbriata]